MSRPRPGDRPSKPAEPGNQIREYGVALALMRARGAECAHIVAALPLDCSKAFGEEGKSHLVACTRCCDRALTAIQYRFHNSSDASGDNAEWFAHIDRFVPSVIDRIAAVRQRRAIAPQSLDLASELVALDAWLVGQKEAWFRTQLARSRSLLVAAAYADKDKGLPGSGLPSPLAAVGAPPTLLRQPMAQELERALSDNSPRAVTVAELSDTVASAIGTPDLWWPGGMQEVEAALSLQATPEHAESRQAFARLLFMHEASGGAKAATKNGAANWRAFLELYLGTSDGAGKQCRKSLFDVMGVIAVQQSVWLRERPQRDAARLRLDELRRALAAMGGATKVSRGPQGRNEPPVHRRAGSHHIIQGPARNALGGDCHSCGFGLIADNYLVCAICRFMAEYGPQAMAMYCSDRCQKRSHDEHIRLTHHCRAGHACISLLRPRPSRDDGFSPDMVPVLCRMCLDMGLTPTIYCSNRCAGADAARHLHDVHSPDTPFTGTVELLPALEARLNPVVRAINH